MRSQRCYTFEISATHKGCRGMAKWNGNYTWDTPPSRTGAVSRLTVATCQIPVGHDINQNADVIIDLIHRAAMVGVDVVHFPECAISGYGPAVGRNGMPSHGRYSKLLLREYGPQLGKTLSGLWWDPFTASAQMLGRQILYSYLIGRGNSPADMTSAGAR